MKKALTNLTPTQTFKTLLVSAFLLAICVCSSFGNPIDSDLSNTAGTNSGKSHLDIYLFIVALLVICVVIPFWEDRNKNKA